MKAPAPAISLQQTLATLGDAMRLRMLRLLERHELTVGELAQVLQIAQSSASRQAKALGEAGWLAKRHEGTACFYRLVPADLSPPLKALWGAIEPQLSGVPGHDEDDRRVAGVLEERKTDSINFFGRVRGEWDQVRSDLFGARFTAAALLSLIRPDWVVADIGCGTGNVAEMLAPFVERVVAIDQSEPMLAAARRRLASRRNVDFVRGSMGSLSLAARSIDAAVCMLVLHHVPDVPAALADVAKSLRTTRGGGVLTIVDMVPHDRSEYRHSMGHVHQGFSRKQVMSLLTGAGFGRCTHHELPAEPDSRGPGLFVASGRIT
ncbi:MAG: metalloregulator ArsR/SmtB family transcription factor [Phycisphaerae bacterium]|jgi:ArsR family transcriptional regulator